MSEDLRHFIAYAALTLLIAGFVAALVAASRQKKTGRRQAGQHLRIDLVGDRGR